MPGDPTNSARRPSRSAGRSSARRQSSASGTGQGGQKGEEAGGDDHPHLVDESGRDVTPKSLLPSAAQEENAAVFKIFSRGNQHGTSMENAIQGEQDEAAADTEDIIGGGGFSVSGASIRSGDASEDESDENAESKDETPRADVGEGYAAQLEGKGDDDDQSQPEMGVDRVRQAVRSLMSEYDANTLLSLQLEETDTDILLEMKSSRVMSDTPYAEQVQSRNDRYGEYTAHMSRSGDGYVGKYTQTLHGTGSAGAGKLTKGIQARPIPTDDASVQASVWDIADANYALQKAAASQTSEGLELLQRSTQEKSSENAGEDFQEDEGASEEEDAWASDEEGEGKHSKSKKKDAVDEYAIAALERQVNDVLSAGNSAPGFLLDSEGSVRIAPVMEKVEDDKEVRRRAIQEGTSRSGRTSSRRESQRNAVGISVGESLRGYGNSQSNNTSRSSNELRHGIESTNNLETSTQDSSSVSHDSNEGEEEDGEDGGGDEMHDKLAREKQLQELISSRQLMSGLSVVERAVQQNLYHHAHRLYRSRAGLEAVEGLLAGMRNIIVAAVRLEQTKFGSDAKQGPGSNDLFTLASKIRQMKAEEARLQNQKSVLQTEKPEDQEETQQRGLDSEQRQSSSDAGKRSPDESEATEESASSDDNQEAEEEGEAAVDAGERSEHEPGMHLGEDAGTELASTLAVLAERANDVGNRNVAALLEGLQSLALGPKASPGLLLLFSYSCADVKNMAVNSIAWNRINSDLLAAGYGPSSYIPPSKSRGYLALWSIKNPEYPQALVRVESGVTALDFSAAHPNLLAVGLYDGRIAIYDVRRLLTGDAFVSPEAISEPLAPGAHTEVVWEVKWVDTSPSSNNTEEDKQGSTEDDFGSTTTGTTASAPASERLVSISSDGKVNEWNTKKGLQCRTLIHLKQPRTEDLNSSDPQQAALSSTTSEELSTALQNKKYGNLTVPKPVPNHSANISGLTVEDAVRNADSNNQTATRDRGPAGAASKHGSNDVHEARISRTVSGLCFDFPQSDPSSYLAGAEDGHMHQCSVSYNEQTLRSYKVHGGPINKLRISPFYEPAVITAGGDWCVRLWDLAESSAEEEGVKSKEQQQDDDKSDKETANQKNFVSDMETPVAGFASPDSRDAVADLQWHPQVSTWLGSVSGDGHICVWEVGSGAPLVDHIAREPEEGQEHNQGIIGLIKSAGEERVDKDQGEESDEESEYGGKEDKDHRKPSQSAQHRARSESSESSDSGPSEDSGEDAKERELPTKRLTCFLFARDAPVVVTGDSSGRIDVYRLMGSVSQAKFTGYTEAQLTEELYYAMHPDRQRAEEDEAEG
eukprot:gb/GECG01012549.1/.p1 GENE.gb/GECG01012549.1/~~gb/GECG01012549.1/.p1  ORF type:complete len:1327 (+),score=271.85 gb/GECG01012549.1/:1-3981(+)